MRTKIAGEYPEAEFLRYSAQVIYVADFSERTKAVRKLYPDAGSPGAAMPAVAQMTFLPLTAADLGSA